MRLIFFCCKQKTAYEMRISDWSSDVCSSDLPTGLYILMPVIALLGTLMGLGTLAAQNEVTAMRASGMTVVQLGVATLMAGVLLGGFDVVLGDVLAPAGTQAAHNFRSATRDSEPAGLATRPLWLRDGQSVVHIGTLKSEREIANVEVYQLGDDLSLQSALHADDGDFVEGQWHLTGIARPRFQDGPILPTKLH